MTTIEKVAVAPSTYTPPSLLNPAFKYTPANKTDIAETFKRVREQHQAEKDRKRGT